MKFKHEKLTADATRVLRAAKDETACFEALEKLVFASTSEPELVFKFVDDWSAPVAAVEHALRAFPSHNFEWAAMAFLADFSRYYLPCAVGARAGSIALIVLRDFKRRLDSSPHGATVLSCAAIVVACVCTPHCEEYDTAAAASLARLEGAPELLVGVMKHTTCPELLAACASALTNLFYGYDGDCDSDGDDVGFEDAAAVGASVLACRRLGLIDALIRGLSAPRDGSADSANAVQWCAAVLEMIAERDEWAIQAAVDGGAVDLLLSATRHWSPNTALQRPCLSTLSGFAYTCSRGMRLPAVYRQLPFIIDAAAAAIRLACAAPHSRRGLAEGAACTIRNAAFDAPAQVRS